MPTFGWHFVRLAFCLHTYKMMVDMMMVMMMLSLGKTDSLNPHRVRDQ